MVGAIAGLAATLAVLGLLGRGRLAGPPLADPAGVGRWLGQRSPVEAAMALLRLGLVAVTAYLLAITVLAAVAGALRAARLVRLADMVTLPAARRLVHAGLGLGLAGAALAPSPTHPASRPRLVAAVRRGPDDTVTMRLLDDAPRPTSTTTTTATTVAPPAPAPPAPATWTVRPGDSCWSIAEDVLTTSLGRPPTEAQVVPYWRALIAGNAGVFADPGNADLVFAGQVFVLPPTG
jgi:hypothetical protein